MSTVPRRVGDFGAEFEFWPLEADPEALTIAAHRPPGYFECVPACIACRVCVGDCMGMGAGVLPRNRRGVLRVLVLRPQPHATPPPRLCTCRCDDIFVPSSKALVERGLQRAVAEWQQVRCCVLRAAWGDGLG